MTDYAYFNNINYIHNTVQKIKTSNVRDELKDSLCEEYDSVLSNLKILSDSYINALDQLSSAKALSDEFLKKIVNLVNNLGQSIKNAQDQIYQIKHEDHKFDRIAVIFVGHARTFTTCMPHHLYFFNKMSRNVDYYMVTWDQSDYATSDYQVNYLLPITKIDVHRNLQVYFGSLLKGIKVVDSNAVDFSEVVLRRRGLWKMLNLTYLSKIGNSLKQTYEKENNFVYDQVIEMRPDIVHNTQCSPKDPWFFKCKDDDLVTDLCKYNRQQSNSEILIGNWYWRMNSDTHNKFSKIHDFLIDNLKTQTKENDPFHNVLTDYFYKNPYNIHKGLDSFETVHVKTPDDLTPF